MLATNCTTQFGLLHSPYIQGVSALFCTMKWAGLAFVLFLSSALLAHADRLYYGRVWGTATKWTRNDKGDSHHLEVSFAPVKDLDSGDTYSQFTANIDVRSFDGSSMYYALLNGSALVKSGLPAKTQSPIGLKKIDKSQGVVYSDFLDSSDFTVLDEDALVSLLEKFLGNSRMVYLWGQVYHDDGGAVGIHDIHRIEGQHYQGYGDGAFLVQSQSGEFFGCFLHFNDQPVAEDRR